MMKVAFSSSFNRAIYKKIKNQPGLEEKFWDCTKIFIENPYDRRLKTHKLSGQFKDLWSFTIDYDIRVVFYFTKNKDESIFIDIGSHNEVY